MYKHEFLSIGSGNELTRADLLDRSDIIKSKVGAKGYGLLFMNEVGLQVPKFYILSTNFWRTYKKEGQLNRGQLDCINNQLSELESTTGKKMGNIDSPLFVSIRSGSVVSMPGAMKTYLNVGINDETVNSLAKEIGQVEAFKCYFNLIKDFAIDVFNIEESSLPMNFEEGSSTPIEQVNKLKDAIIQLGHAFPQDPQEQFITLINKVFDSWDSEEARLYREKYNISDKLGTACIIQEMKFGNVEEGGSGVLFSHDPESLEKTPLIAFKNRVQGKEVVGETTHDKKTVDDFSDESIKRQLKDIIKKASIGRWKNLPLEVEFTIDNKGNVWPLQIRDEPLSSQGYFRLIKQMVEQEGLLLTEGLINLPNSLLNDLVIPPLNNDEVLQALDEGRLIGSGSGLNLGNASGILLTYEDALNNRADNVILVGRLTRRQLITLPEKVVGIANQGGGIGSHSSIILRRLGIPAIVGLDATNIPYSKLVTIDGKRGQLFEGKINRLKKGDLPDLSDDEALLVKEWLDYKQANPWLYTIGDIGQYFQFKREAFEVFQRLKEEHKSHKALEIGLTQRLFPQEMLIEYLTYRPSQKEEIKKRLSEIVKQGYDATLRTGHAPFFPSGGPWTMVTSEEDIYRLFNDTDYSKYGNFDSIVGDISSNGTNHKVEEVFIGKIPKDKLNPNPEIQKKHAAFTLNISPTGEIVCQIAPHTSQLRSLEPEEKNIDSLITISIEPTRYMEGTNRLRIKVGKELLNDEDIPEFVRSLISKFNQWVEKDNIFMRIAAIQNTFSPKNFTQIVLEGQMRIGEKSWIKIYGIKADPLNNNH